MKLPGASNQSKPDIVSGFVQVNDMTPTFLDYPGVKYLLSPYKEKDLVVPTTGKSIKPLLEGSVQTLHGENQIISQELFGNSAIFMGDYKGLLMRPPCW
jgi:hypothetical protein